MIYYNNIKYKMIMLYDDKILTYQICDKFHIFLMNKKNKQFKLRKYLK